MFRQKVQEDDLEVYLYANQKKIYRFAYSYTHNDADTKDMIQLAMCKAFQKLPTLKQVDYMETWFYRILINTCLDHLRTTKKEAFYPLKEDAFITQMEDIALKEQLHTLLLQLDATTRTILILRFFEDRKLDEIADIMEMPLSTVKTRLYKGLATMRIQMEEDEL